MVMKLSTVIAIAAGIGLSAALFQASLTSETTGRRAAAATTALRLLDSRCFAEHGFRQIVGRVRNTTDRPIASVMAVGTFSTSGGALVKVESALLEYDPIMPGQTSPFRVIGTDNPEISNCEIGFRNLFGPAILYSR